MNKNRLFVSVIALALLVVAMLTVESSIATSATVSGGNDLSNNALPQPGAAVEGYFPGKVQDDLVVAGTAIGKSFPGKVQDDLVASGTTIANRFPGKAQDDLFVNETTNVWHTPAYQDYTP